MEQQTKIRILRELLRQLDEKVNVDAGVQLKNPAEAYTSVQLADQEWRTFFLDHPQLIGLSGDLRRNGSYFTIDDFGIPVRATRDETGRFRAFVNACRHRSVRIANETRGDATRFMCPFHNWTYGSNGELVGIPREADFGPIDKSCMGLIELPAAERYGQLWVHPKVDGKLDVDHLLGDLAPEIAEWNAGDLIYLGESEMKMKLNWKLANDTFGETYHFQRLHKNTLGRLFYGDALAYEIFGRNHRFVFANRGIDQLRNLPEDQWDTEGTANVLYFLFPNIQFNVSKHSIALIKIYPDRDNPGRSITRVGHYYSQEAIDAAEQAFVTATTPRSIPSSRRIARCSCVCGRAPSAASTTSRKRSMPVLWWRSLFMLDTCAGEITTLGFSFSGKSLCGVAVIANLPSPSSTRRIRCSVVSLVAVSSSV